MKYLSGSVIALLLMLSSGVYATTVTYSGTFNGSPVTLRFDIADGLVLKGQYIACQTEEETTCAGPGTYAYFDQTGSVTFAALGSGDSADLNLSLYVGEEDTQRGVLSGNFNLMDRTLIAQRVDDKDQMTSYQFSEFQDGANPIAVSVTQNRITALSFPSKYTIGWTLANANSPRGFDGGYITLTKDQ